LKLLKCVKSSLGHHETGGVCESAPDQSPINIIPSEAIQDDEQCDAELDWYINTNHALFEVADTCQTEHTVKVTAVREDGSGYANDALQSVAVLTTEHLPKVMQKHEEYCLAQFHIHWGANNAEGSEHKVNGHAYQLEMHFVHFACEYGTFAAAQAEGARTGGTGSADHTLAVVALFFELSEDDNPAFDLILNHVGEECKDTERGALSNEKILRHILPNGWRTGGYYAYQGGLTTTPCTDDVNWIVLNTKASISANQLAWLRALENPHTGEEITANFREIVQNPNPVYSCVDDEDEDEDEDDEESD